MPRGERTASRSMRGDFRVNRTPDFEQIVVERIEPHAEPQVSIQAGDGRILIEKNKYKHPSALVDQALMEGLTA